MEGGRRRPGRSTKVRSFVNKIRMIWLVVSVVLFAHLMDDKHLNIVLCYDDTVNAYAKMLSVTVVCRRRTRGAMVR